MRLVEGVRQLGAAVGRHQGGVFRGGDERRAPGRRVPHQLGGVADILRHIVAGTQLNAGCPEDAHYWMSFNLSLILARPAIAQSSSWPSGVPETLMVPTSWSPIMIGLPPGRATRISGLAANSAAKAVSALALATPSVLRILYFTTSCALPMAMRWVICAPLSYEIRAIGTAALS